MVGGQHDFQSERHKARAVSVRKSFIYGKKSPNDQNDGARKIVLFENEKKLWTRKRRCWSRVPRKSSRSREKAAWRGWLRSRNRGKMQIWSFEKKFIHICRGVRFTPTHVCLEMRKIKAMENENFHWNAQEMAKRCEFLLFRATPARMGAGWGPRTPSHREKRATAHMSWQMFSLDKCFELHISEKPASGVRLSRVVSRWRQGRSRKISRKPDAIVNELSAVHQVIPTWR